MSAPGERRLALLREQKALLDAFMALTEEQAELLAQEDVDGLGQSLARRQALIDRIDPIRRELETLEAEGAADRAEANLRRDIQETLHAIREKDARNEGRLQAQMARLGDEIRKLSESQKGLDGYSRAGSFGASAYFDSKF